jgi:competence protein ComFC
LAKQYSNRLASKYLGQLIWQKTDIHMLDFDYIVPVPLHWTRYAWRWFNQAEVIAQELSKESGKPVVHLLKRNRNTGYQAGLSREKRLKNLFQAFALTKEAHHYKGKKILLVDDVMTTGTTLKTCARELIKIDPKEIFIAVACRTF